MKPWWLATFSFGLLSTDTIEKKAFLAPGFCPYRNLYSINQSKDIQDKITKTLTIEETDDLEDIQGLTSMILPKVLANEEDLIPK